MDSKRKKAIPGIADRIGLRGRKGSKPFSYFDLIDIMDHPGCPVCNLIIDKCDRYLNSIFTEMLLKPETHQSFRERRGLCAQHSARAGEYIGGSLEIAMLFTKGLEEVVKALGENLSDDSGRWLQNLSERNGKAASLESRLAPTGPCIVCVYMEEREKRYIETLCKFIGDRKLSAAFEASEGLCLPHFRIALNHARKTSARERLIAIHRKIWTSLKRDLDSFISKNNYLRKHEINQHEGDSWRRVIRIAGNSGVFGPD